MAAARQSRQPKYQADDSWIVTARRICQGQPHIRGTRIRVQEVALWHERLGLSVPEIVNRQPQLAPAAVEAALIYYAEHRSQIPLPLAVADTLSPATGEASAGLRAQVTRPAAPSGALAPMGATTHEARGDNIAAAVVMPCSARQPA